MNDIKAYWISAVGNLRQSWPQILIMHLVFTALGVFLFTPLIGLTGRLLLKLSGETALADQDIAYFLLSPLGMFALIVFSALLIGILTFEQAAMMRIATSDVRRRAVSSNDALMFTMAKVNKIFLFTLRLVIRVLLLTLPFLAVAAAIAFYLITDYDINYYLTEKPPEFWTAIILIGIILITMSVILVRKLLGWSLALPLVLFTDILPAESFYESTRIAQGNRKLFLVLLLSWGTWQFCWQAWFLEPFS